MKFKLSLILFVALVPMLVVDAAAQGNSGAAQTVAELRAQLADVQAKENELQARARRLDEDLKPDNIERSLAGVGSTKPEELREQRRRQLTIEQNGVRTQLNLLATSRERLESAIRTAEGAAYQQSAEGFATPLNQTTMLQSAGGARWSFFSIRLTSLVALLGIVFVVALVLWSYRARSLDGN
jgi:cobalamin biosynthesis Mg chelatase CobN